MTAIDRIRDQQPERLAKEEAGIAHLDQETVIQLAILELDARLKAIEAGLKYVAESP